MCRYACDLPLMFKAMSGGASDSLNLDKPVDFKNLTIYYMLSDGGNPLTSFVDGRVVDTIHKVETIVLLFSKCVFNVCFYSFFLSRQSIIFLPSSERKHVWSTLHVFCTELDSLVHT